MTAARPIGRLRALLRREEGMALPTAMFATVAALGLAGAAVISTVDAQHGTHRDNNSKSAIGAADAGANVALLRLRRDAAELSESPCLEGASPEEDGWCPAVGGEIGGGEYSYRVSRADVACGGYDLCVVSTGTVGEVSRRVEVTFTDSTGGLSGFGEGLGGEEGLIGAGDIEIENGTDVRVGVGTNGNVTVENNGNVCGNIRHGVGKSVDLDVNSTQCDGYEVLEGNVNLPPVSSFIPSDIATNNSNYRLATCEGEDLPAGCQEDTYTGKWTTKPPWDPETRTISSFNNTTLTLGGEDYFVCKLDLANNSHLIMAEDAQVRIFFDTPENCELENGETQIYVPENADITSTGYQPEESKFSVPGLYVMGSETIETKIEFRPNGGTNEIFIYAPSTDIVLKNNAVFIGTIVGDNVHVSENVIIEQHDGFELPPHLIPWTTEGSDPVLAAQYYVECSGEATPAPDSGC